MPWRAFETSRLCLIKRSAAAFGIGLAKIRYNQLTEGRREIEIAALLDPNNALIRSYLGKAYFEEKTRPLDAVQFAMAKNSIPTIRRRGSTTPFASKTKIAQWRRWRICRNRLSLTIIGCVSFALTIDQDEAARSASLARLYNSLGFAQQAQAEAAKSLAYDPANHSAHRFLSDSYAGKPRQEIARSSELLQSQLLQPLSLTPLQPSIAETNLNTLTAQGPVSATFNEYNPLFTRNGAHVKRQRRRQQRYDRRRTGDGRFVSSRCLQSGPVQLQHRWISRRADINHDISNAFLQARLTNSLGCAI